MNNWIKPNKAGLTPRWKPMYGMANALTDEFLGYAGAFDVWFDEGGSDGTSLIAIIGPEEAVLREGGYNFDTYVLENKSLTLDGAQDLNIDPYHMCLIYQLCEENGVFVREDPNG